MLHALYNTNCSPAAWLPCLNGSSSMFKIIWSETFYCRVSIHIYQPSLALSSLARGDTCDCKVSKHQMLITFSLFQQTTPNMWRNNSRPYVPAVRQHIRQAKYRHNGGSSRYHGNSAWWTFQWLSPDYSICLFDIMTTAEWACRSLQRQCHTRAFSVFSQSWEKEARESLRTAELFCHQVAKHVYAR